MNAPFESRSRERQQADRGKLKGHLPRLAPEFYRGFAFVHWTLTVENRTTGWLAAALHHDWQLCLLHACARYRLACPAYVLMPDHMHLVWLGLRDDSDQRLAIEFFRRHLRPALSPADWQRQAHDHMLRDGERKRDAFVNLANYIFENPVRAGLAQCSADYPFLGCCVPGYPELDVRAADYWERFWRVYNHLVTT
jgi:REP element-mobilizing transposase RayT